MNDKLLYIRYASRVVGGGIAFALLIWFMMRIDPILIAYTVIVLCVLALMSFVTIELVYRHKKRDKEQLRRDMNNRHHKDNEVTP